MFGYYKFEIFPVYKETTMKYYEQKTLRVDNITFKNQRQSVSSRR